MKTAIRWLRTAYQLLNEETQGDIQNVWMPNEKFDVANALINCVIEVLEEKEGIAYEDNTGNC